MDERQIRIQYEKALARAAAPGACAAALRARAARGRRAGLVHLSAG